MNITIGNDCIRRWATDLREEFEQQKQEFGDRLCSATLKFFENGVNEMGGF